MLSDFGIVWISSFPLTGSPADATDLLQKLTLDPKSAAGDGKEAKKKVRARFYLSTISLGHLTLL
jgi:hypothetical protein